MREFPELRSPVDDRRLGERPGANAPRIERTVGADRRRRLLARGRQAARVAALVAGREEERNMAVDVLLLRRQQIHVHFLPWTCCRGLLPLLLRELRCWRHSCLDLGADRAPMVDGSVREEMILRNAILLCLEEVEATLVVPLPLRETFLFLRLLLTLRVPPLTVRLLPSSPASSSRPVYSASLLLVRRPVAVWQKQHHQAMLPYAQPALLGPGCPLR